MRAQITQQGPKIDRKQQMKIQHHKETRMGEKETTLNKIAFTRLTTIQGARIKPPMKQTTVIIPSPISMQLHKSRKILTKHSLAIKLN